MSAIPIEPASNIEVRLTRIESELAHLGSTVGEMRTDLRDLGRRVDHHLHYLIGSQAAVLTVVLGTMAKGFHWL